MNHLDFFILTHRNLTWESAAAQPQLPESGHLLKRDNGGKRDNGTEILIFALIWNCFNGGFFARQKRLKEVFDRSDKRGNGLI